MEEEKIEEVVETSVVETPVVETDKPQENELTNLLDNVVKLTLLNMIQNLLTQENTKLISFSISDETKQLLLKICHKSPESLIHLEDTLNKILADNKLTTADTPEFIILVSTLYDIIRKYKIPKTVNPTEAIKTLLTLAIILYFKKSNIQNDELKKSLLLLVDTTLKLINIKPISLSIFSFCI